MNDVLETTAHAMSWKRGAVYCPWHVHVIGSRVFIHYRSGRTPANLLHYRQYVMKM